RTPKHLKTYSVFLLNNAIIDVLSATASALGTVRVVQDHEGSMIFVFLGPCTFVSELLCRFCQSLHINLVQHSTVVLLLSFCFRLYILAYLIFWCDICDHFIRVSRSTKNTNVPNLFPQVAYYFEEADVHPATMNKLNLNGYVASNYNMTTVRAMMLDTLICSLPAIVMTLIFIVRFKLLKKIEKAKPNEKQLHVSIARALTFQLLLPCGQSAAVVFWGLDVLNVWSSEFSERIIMVTCSVFSLASPLINFFVLPPYRSIILRSR
ncbi:hypothetical protein PMAYCL1PPCAC_15621, partial [Pristionchus mayeri]